MLVKAIQLLQKVFNGKVILEFPFAANAANFEITKTGTYSIWQKSQGVQLLPFNRCCIKIKNELTGEAVPLNTSGAGPSSNNGIVRRMKLFSFSAGEGTYKATLAEGSGSLETPDKGKYFIQVRESGPDHYIPVAIALIILSVACIIGGSIFGTMAEQLF